MSSERRLWEVTASLRPPVRKNEDAVRRLESAWPFLLARVVPPLVRHPTGTAGRAAQNGAGDWSPWSPWEAGANESQVRTRTQGFQPPPGYTGDGTSSQGEMRMPGGLSGSTAMTQKRFVAACPDADGELRGAVGWSAEQSYQKLDGNQLWTFKVSVVGSGHFVAPINEAAAKEPYRYDGVAIITATETSQDLTTGAVVTSTSKRWREEFHVRDVRYQQVVWESWTEADIRNRIASVTWTGTGTQAEIEYVQKNTILGMNQIENDASFLITDRQGSFGEVLDSEPDPGTFARCVSVDSRPGSLQLHPGQSTTLQLRLRAQDWRFTPARMTITARGGTVRPASLRTAGGRSGTVRFTMGRGRSARITIMATSHRGAARKRITITSTPFPRTFSGTLTRKSRAYTAGGGGDWEEIVQVAAHATYVLDDTSKPGKAALQLGAADYQARPESLQLTVSGHSYEPGSSPDDADACTWSGSGSIPFTGSLRFIFAGHRAGQSEGRALGNGQIDLHFVCSKGNFTQRRDAPDLEINGTGGGTASRIAGTRSEGDNLMTTTFAWNLRGH